MSILSQWQETYKSLRSQTSSWSRSSDVLMNQALLLVVNDARDRCDELLEYWDVCHKSTSFWSGLRGELFNTVGVIGMISGMEPEEIIKRTENNLKSLRDIGLTGFFTAGSIYTKGTALFMALHTDDPSELLSKMKQIMEGWKQDHPWVTGNNDIFYGLLHAMQDSDPSVQVQLTEDCFQALKRGGYTAWGPWADELQASAQIVSLWPDVDVDSLDERYAATIQMLTKEFSFFSPNLRPTAALLAASGLSIADTIPQIVRYYKTLDSGNLGSRLNVAIDLVLLEHFTNEKELNNRLIAIVVGLMYAQEIATVYALAAAAAAT